MENYRILNSQLTSSSNANGHFVKLGRLNGPSYWMKKLSDNEPWLQVYLFIIYTYIFTFLPGSYVFTSVRLSVCLCVARISQQILPRFSCKFVEGLTIDQGSVRSVLFNFVNLISNINKQAELTQNLSPRPAQSAGRRPEGEGANIDQRLVPYHGKSKANPISHRVCLSPRPAPTEGRRPDGEGANLDRRLVPYHGKCKRIQSRIEFIYIYMCGTRSFLR